MVLAISPTPTTFNPKLIAPSRRNDFRMQSIHEVCCQLFKRQHKNGMMRAQLI